MKLTRFILVFVLITILLTGCGLIGGKPVQTSVAQTAVPTINPNLTLPPPETEAASPTVVETPTLPATPTIPPTATVEVIPNQPATTTANNVNLRQGPGTLFQIMTQLPENTSVTVLGKALGDDWLYIDTGRQQGWVMVDFTNLYQTPALASAPLQDVTGAQVIHGQVLDTNLEPVQGIEFAAFQGKEASNPPSTRAHSMADGSFYLYLPETAAGTWRVSFTGVNCKSRIVDANCKYTGTIQPLLTDITLPASGIFEVRYTP